MPRYVAGVQAPSSALGGPATGIPAAMQGRGIPVFTASQIMENVALLVLRLAYFDSVHSPFSILTMIMFWVVRPSWSVGE